MARKQLTTADLAILAELERKVLWLSSWTIHHANHVRESADGLKVGGHQASSASLATIMTALYFHVLRPQDRVAVKPHASPNFHAIQYLLGKQTRDKLEAFRGYKGAQSYPSRTKDADDVDFSTGSVGLGVAQTLFSSLVQDYVRAHFPSDRPEGRMIALVGDAEMDEGNIFEAMLEGWKQGLRNCWWIIDYNRQSLDAVIREGLWARYEALFKAFGWDVVIVKHGSLQEAAFKEPGGEALRTWINNCPNQLYSALTFQGGAAWRKRLTNDLGDQGPVSRLIDKRSDEELARLMGNLGGHDLPSLIEAFDKAATNDRPTCFICYTIKGSGLALAGHKDNHAGMMTPAQMDQLREAMSIRAGHEWDKFEGLKTPANELQGFLDRVPFATKQQRRHVAPRVEVPSELAIAIQPTMSTQFGFGALLNELGRGDSDFVKRIVTTSPDVTVSTNLGPWVNRRNLFAREKMADTFKSERIASTFNWEFAPTGQHIELGIAENNLFIALSALGLSHSINGERLFPIGTLYDPFIARGLDALNYACYQEARFILVATPSGITLAGEGGAHQSIGTPLIGMAQDGLAAFEPAYRGRARRDPRLVVRLHPEGWRRRAVRAQLAARRDRRLGLPAALDAPGRADQARDESRAAPGHHRRRLLDAQTRAELPGGRRLHRRGRARGDRGGRADGRGPARRRAARGHLGRPAQCRLDRGAARARARPRQCALAHRAADGRHAAALRHRHRVRRASGDARLARRDPRPSHPRARGRALRPDRLDPGSLSPLRHRRECDRRGRRGDRARTADPLPQGAAVASEQCSGRAATGRSRL